VFSVDKLLSDSFGVNVRLRGISGLMISPTKRAAQCFTETWEVLRSTAILGIPKIVRRVYPVWGLNCFLITVEHGARNSSTRRSIGASFARLSVAAVVETAGRY
jgi:hypothetical protein